MYKKINDKPLELFWSCDNDGESRPAVVYDGESIFVDDFIRTHGNPWVEDVYPDFIQGYKAITYDHVLYIEMIDCDNVNLYVFEAATEH